MEGNKQVMDKDESKSMLKNMQAQKRQDADGLSYLHLKNNLFQIWK